MSNRQQFYNRVVTGILQTIFHTMKHCLTVKGNKVLAQAATHVSLENMPSIGPSPRTRVCGPTSVKRLGATGKLTETERSVSSSGKGM